MSFTASSSLSAPSAGPGDLFVVSAPSGAGKSTILRRVIAEVDGVAFSISHTTRPMRKGERPGVDYHFVTRERFMDMVEEGAFLEWARVHGNLYGTSKAEIEASLHQGLDIILDIDVQGAAQVKARFPAAVTIFVVPPSLEELERRLRGRGTEDDATVALRLENARLELKSVGFYDYVVVNDILDRAVEEMKLIIAARRLTVGRRMFGPWL